MSANTAKPAAGPHRVGSKSTCHGVCEGMTAISAYFWSASVTPQRAADAIFCNP
jgi:hypothetical protein